MDFRGDERGQPVVIGSLLVFAILVLAFSGYQAFVVPNQNADVEFDHEKQVQTQFLEIRNDIMRSVADGTISFTDLELGTDYPVRLVALNPPPASGTLETTEPRQISATDNGSDITGTICRGPDQGRILEYEADYNEFTGNPTYKMENTVAYRQFDGSNSTQTTQRILNDRTVNLVLIQGSLSESGVEAKSVEPIPGRVKFQTVTDPVIEVPTALDETTWNDLLEGELDDGESASVGDGNLVLDLEGDYNLVCSPVGINSAPPAGMLGDGELSDSTLGRAQVNPSGPKAVLLTDISPQSQNDKTNITFTFENRGDENRTFEQARFAIYYAPNAETQQNAILRGESLELRGDYVTVSNPIEIESGDTETVVLDFEKDATGHLIGMSVIDDRNKESLYIGESDSTAAPTGITASHISDLENGTNGQMQTFEFDIAGELAHNEDVTIDVSSPNRKGVGYQGASSTNVTDGNGNATMSASGKEITFTAGSDGHEGTVTIEVDGIDVDSDTADSTFEIPFTREDSGNRDSEQFRIT